MPERERIPDARFGKDDAECIVSGFFETEALQGLLYTLRRVVKIRNARSGLRVRSATRTSDSIPFH